MDSQLAKKIIIDVQISGWSCLIPASGLLYLYQVTHYASFLWGLALVVLYAAYVLATAKLDKAAVPKLRFADELDRDVLRRLPAFNSAFVLLQPGA